MSAARQRREEADDELNAAAELKAAMLKAFKATGLSKARIAHALGIQPQALTKWKKIPENRVRTIRELSGLSKHEIRPDLYDMDD
jgi:transposase-like protein